jgi:hypothetical protein
MSRHVKLYKKNNFPTVQKQHLYEKELRESAGERYLYTGLVTKTKRSLHSWHSTLSTVSTYFTFNTFTYFAHILILPISEVLILCVCEYFAALPAKLIDILFTIDEVLIVHVVFLSLFEHHTCNF